MHQVDERRRHDKRRRQHNKGQFNNQLKEQMRGKQEVEALVDKRRQRNNRASMDNTRLAVADNNDKSR